MGDAVTVHDVEGHDSLLESGGGAVGGEGGNESGEGEGGVVLHGADGIPHGLEEAVAAEDVDHEIPRAGGVVEGEARPAEELDGAGGGGVGEGKDGVNQISSRDDAATREGRVHVCRGSTRQDIPYDPNTPVL